MIKRLTGAISGVLLLTAFSVGLAEPIKYARYPALSPDGETIAFTYRGDIWTVSATGGQARRLTVHEAEDIRPQFSPDGQWLAFASRRYNNYDVYIMPAEGGTPRQLTFNSDYDIPTSWFPDSDSLLILSYRDYRGDIFKVSIDGGMPIKLTGYNEEREYAGRITADRRYLLYCNGSGPYRWWRRDLRTARNADIWLADRSAAEFSSRRLTDWANHDLWPVLNEAAGEVYFVSCRGEWSQIFKVPLAGGETEQVTEFSGDGVQFLNSNPQGDLLVFEQGFDIWLMDPQERQPRKVVIEIASDEHFNLVDKKTLTKDVEWYSVSPDGKKVAAVVHGEVFILPAEEPEIGRRVSFTTARERYPVWGGESRTLYYASDRDGNYDIFALDVVTGAETRFTQSELNETKPLVSPDGKYLVYYRGLQQIIRRDLETGRETVWVEGNFYDLGVEPTYEYDWSPDSRWLVLTMAGATYDTDVHLVSLDGDLHNISQFSGWNFRPRFAADGKSVYFTGSPDDQYDTYKIELMHPPLEFPEAVIDSLFIPEPAERSDSENDDLAAQPVTVDFENIATRRRKAYDLAASSSWPILTPDGEKFLFVSSIMGKPEIWSVNTEDDPDLTQLTHTGDGKGYLTVSSDSKTLYYLEDGLIKSLDLDKQKTEALQFTATLEVDLQENNRQKFHETWRMLNDYFYDPTFRGTNWSDARDKYEVALPDVRTETEFRNLVLEMMG
jgi:Tol biopolymer transport system component